MRYPGIVTLNLVVLTLLSGGCAGKGRMQSPTMVSGGMEAQQLDLANFIGERLHLAATYPSHISRLQLNLIFPEQHKLLAEAHPSIALYGSDGRLLWQHEIEANQADYVVNRKLSAPTFYAKIGVYYCYEGEQGLCMIQNILYEVDASDRLPPGPLKLEYQLPGSYF